MPACENCGKPATTRWDTGALTCDRCRPGDGESPTPLAVEAVALTELRARALVTRAEAARLCGGISVDAFDDHVRPHVRERVVGSKPMFKPADLDKFADGGSVPM